MKIRRTKFVKFSAFAGLVALAALGIALRIGSAVVSSPDMEFVVVIDAGHGGVDGGVSGVASGVKESDLNLDIARKLKARLDESGVKTVMTRTTPNGLYGAYTKGFKKRDMLKRKRIILDADADVFVSIHQNYYSSSSRRGAQVFFKSGSEGSEELARLVQSSLSLASGGRKYSPLVGDYYVLNQANCAAILCECGFLSNREDEAALLSEEYREKLAAAICDGINSFRFSASAVG